MVAAAIPIPESRIAEICRRYGISHLRLFGSALRQDFDHDRSDIDLLVEFAPGRIPDFFVFDEIAEQLSDAFEGRTVDLVTARALNHRIRDRVLAEAKPIYGDRG